MVANGELKQSHSALFTSGVYLRNPTLGSRRRPLLEALALETALIVNGSHATSSLHGTEISQ